MSNQLAISDLVLFHLERTDTHLAILRERDHLLRRFGLLELVDLAPGIDAAFNLRAEADEIWAPVDGAVELSLVDQRPQSPSYGVGMQLTLDAADPQAVLIPFGVAHAFAAAAPARLLRLSTHSRVHPLDRQGSIAEWEIDQTSGAR